MTKKNQQRGAILRHGFNLIRVFGMPEGTSPVALYKRLHRIEAEAHTFAERYCNGEVTEEQDAKKEASILKRLDAILGFNEKGIPVLVNSDPRGYALKIDDAYVREHNLDIHRDWGGYGILAPDF